MIDLKSRRELFVDRLLIEELRGVEFRLHEPRPAPRPLSPISGAYLTVLLDEGLYRAYFRRYDPSWQGEQHDGNPGEATCYAESRDGAEWLFPDLGLCEVAGSRHNSVILRRPPYSHNFAPFRDLNPGAESAAKYKALAGTHAGGALPGGGLHAFGSPDGLRWELLQPEAVLDFPDFAFDSQNVSFWSEAEACYVCFFRTWQSSAGRLRAIHKTTSADFVHWTDPVATNANLAGEHLYTSQTHPYFRAPHLYVALPTRFQPERGDSTDILFAAMRAGAPHYERLFPEAFLRPGLDPASWGNRSNYAACGVVPTGPTEISLYHCNGLRYTLRTDGFVSLRAGYAGGTVTTKPFLFSGGTLSLNVATSAGGSVRVELLEADGAPVAGRSAAQADEIVGDATDRQVTWGGEGDVSAAAGRPVRLRFALREADLYSFVFAD